MNWLQFFHLKAAPRMPLDPLDSDRMQLAELCHKDAAQRLTDTLRNAVEHTANAVENHGKDNPTKRPPWT